MDAAAFAGRLAAAAALSGEVPPDHRTPYANHYAARRLLIDLKADLLACAPETAEPQREILLSQLAEVWLRIGQNLIQCHETADGRGAVEAAQRLLEALRARQPLDPLPTPTTLKNPSLTDPTPIPTSFDPGISYASVDLLVEVYNTLAMQWSAWQADPTAERLLLNATRIYEDWRTHHPPTAIPRERHHPWRPRTPEDPVRRLLSDSEGASEACAGLLEAERTRQLEALQQKLLKKRAQKGLTPSGPPPDTLEPFDTTAGRLESSPEVPQDTGAARPQSPPDADQQRQSAQRLHTQHAVTCSALGQVYDRLGQPHQAAGRYLRALDCQLLLMDFDRQQWVRDASGLALYYLGESELPQAAHCLEAADCLIPPSPACSAETRNLLDLVWGKYLHRLLKLSEEVAAKLSRDPSFRTAPDLPYTIDGPAEVVLKEQAHVPAARFEGLPLTAPGPSIALVTTLPQAREVFRRAVGRYEAVLPYYTLDAFAEERIAAMQELSGLYGIMAQFEPDFNTKWELQARRIPYLEEFLDKLENVIFTNVLRQYRFELGNVYQAMADIRVEQLRSGRPGGTPAETDALLQKAMGYFTQFVSSFRTEWEVIQKLRTPGERAAEFTLEADYLLPYLLGTCSLAVLTMMQSTETESQRDANVAAAVALYQHCLDFAKKCELEQQEGIREHLVLCREMVRLLPLAHPRDPPGAAAVFFPLRTDCFVSRLPAPKPRTRKG